MSILVFLPGNLLGKDLALRNPVSLAGSLPCAWEPPGVLIPSTGSAEALLSVFLSPGLPISSWWEEHIPGCWPWPQEFGLIAALAQEGNFKADRR